MTFIQYRGIAEMATALALGARDRAFEPHYSDQPLWFVEYCLKVGNTQRRLRKAKQYYDDGQTAIDCGE